jgi:arylsulfatase A-like enzyme
MKLQGNAAVMGTIQQKALEAVKRVGRLSLATIGCGGALLGAARMGQAQSAPAAPEGATQPNVLFLMVDDLRPELGCYGAAGAHTPNIDALAKSGVTFSRQYVQCALCSPSRTSMLTGVRPATSDVYVIGKHFRDTLPDIKTLPQTFKENGYYTQALGKVFHDLKHDDPRSWSEPTFTPPTPPYGPATMPAFLAGMKKLDAQKAAGVQFDPASGMPMFLLVPGPSWEAPDVADDYFWDGQITKQAINMLHEKGNKPFFMAVGYLKPHLPFVAPKKYFDMHPLAEIALPSPDVPPNDLPPVVLANLNEWRRYTDHRAPGKLDAQATRELIRAYRASTTYVDAQIGRLLVELDRMKLRERTIIILWGDNGYTLGEYGLWGKETNFECATRVPLIINQSGLAGAGKTCAALTEAVDIYPTLIDMCHLPVPAALEGRSMLPLLNDPTAQGKTAARSSFKWGDALGSSLRTERYRYTEWIGPRQRLEGAELYDLQADPQQAHNLVNEAAQRDLKNKLQAQLHELFAPQGLKKSKPAVATKANAQ